MSLHEQTRWVVTYDIRDRKRGVAVHRYMKQHGIPLQYSVFVVAASSAQLQRIMLDLEDLIAVHLDDVRAYRWSDTAECHELGRRLTPDGTLVDAIPTGTEPSRRPVAVLT